MDDLKENNFTIVSGGGYPNYFEIIEHAIADLNDFPNINRLVIAVDSEDFTYEEKVNEITDFLSDKNIKIPYFIIIQHFCLETWALGDKSIVKRQPQNKILKDYLKHFDVLNNDPELLTPMESRLNRAQTAEKYLRLLLNERYRNLTYKKSNPEALLHEKYFIALKNRLEETQHIRSFVNFLTAFK